MKRGRDDELDAFVQDQNCELDLGFVLGDGNLEKNRRKSRLLISTGSDGDADQRTIGKNILGSQIAKTVKEETDDETSPLLMVDSSDGEKTTRKEMKNETGSFWEKTVNNFPHPFLTALTEWTETLSLTELHKERYCHFLQVYLGYSEEKARKAYQSSHQCSMIGVTLYKTKNSSNKCIKATRVFLRHSVLSVEGDAFFNAFIKRSKDLNKAEMDFKSLDLKGRTPTSKRNLYAFPQKSKEPNARCVVLHYGLQGKKGAEHKKFPRTSLIVILSSTRIEEGEEVIVSLQSYYRCLDEAEWYKQYYGKSIAAEEIAEDSEVVGDIYDGVRCFERWPKELLYYHGVGQRHASHLAEASFPFTLVNLDITPELGPKELGVIAGYPIPYATCWLYSGPSITTKKVGQLHQLNGKEEADVAGDTNARTEENAFLKEDISFINDDTYALGLGKNAVCFGQSLARYVNHRYNLERYGNVELCSVMLTVKSDLFDDPQQDTPLKPQKSSSTSRRVGRSSKGHKRRPVPSKHKLKRVLEEESENVTIPFFITTCDIPKGQQLLAWTYGEDYDCRLERQVICGGFVVPFQDAEILNRRYLNYYDTHGTLHSRNALTNKPLWQRYNGDYRFALKVGDVVWRRRPIPGSSSCPPPEEDLFVVLSMMRHSIDYVLIKSLRRLKLSSKAMSETLRQHQLEHYESPSTPAELTKKKRRLDSVWALYECDYNTLVQGSTTANSVFISTSSSLVPFQSETDYITIQTEQNPLSPSRSKKANEGKDTLDGAKKKKKSDEELTDSFRVLFNLDDLRHLTSLVRESPKALEIEPLYSGFLWPMFVNAPKQLLGAKLLY